jgi:hypothetical protein
MLIPSLLGGRMYLAMSQTGFRKVVLVLLTAAGVALLGGSAPTLLQRWAAGAPG